MIRVGDSEIVDVVIEVKRFNSGNCRPDHPGVIRFGAPAVTTRGFGTDEMTRLAGLIVRVINDAGNTDVQRQVREEVAEMCRSFPVPGITG